MKHIFIINPVSGKQDATKYLEPVIRETADQLGISYTVLHTAQAGHAKTLAKQFGESGEAVRLYACGGDGTLNEIFAGAYPYQNVEVACVPCGSGNDFLRSFATQSEFSNLADTIAGTAVSIDLIAANNGVSAAICSVGVDADVAHGIPKFRRLPFCGGNMAYNLSLLQCLLKPIGKSMRVTVDGTVFEDNFVIAAACNGTSYGGGYCAAPAADVQDGLIDLVLVKKLNLLRLASVLGIYKKGEHIQNGKVVPALQDIMSYHRAKSICIEPTKQKSVIVNIDGECAPEPMLKAEIMPKSARFVLPKAVFAHFTNK